MRRFRRITALILSISLWLLLPTEQAYAVENPNALAVQQEENVDLLINEIGSLRAQLMVCEDDETAGIQDKIQILETLLISAGGEILSDAEVTSIVNTENTVRAIVPGSTSSVRWYSTQLDYIRNGITYRVEKIYGQALTSASSLGGIGNDVVLFDRDGVKIQGKPNFMSIYVQKTVGLIPVVKYLPYELLFDNAETYSGVISMQCVTTYAYTGTACFCFVYPLMEGIDTERLSYVSTSFNVAGSIVNTGIADAVPFSKSVDFPNVKLEAIDYASANKAIDCYATSVGTMTSYVHAYKFYDYDGTMVHQIILPCPYVITDVI